MPLDFAGDELFKARVSLSDQILFIDAEALVIDKPAGLPVDAPRRGGDSIAGRIEELACGFKRPPAAMRASSPHSGGSFTFRYDLPSSAEWLELRSFGYGATGSS